MRTDEAGAHGSAASPGEGGRNLPGTGAGAEVRAAAGGRTKPEALRVMEAAVERSNMLCAYERVVKNEGAPGVDGLTVAEFKPWLQAHWKSIRQALLAGEYVPAAVRKVEIPKPQGGVRTLGIPTVLDRLIQQALHQVLQPLFEPEFSESSYGFRSGRNAQQAVQAARSYVAEGKRWVVDIDLEKFFDRVNHDVLMTRVARRVKDERVRKLIRRYLEAGMMEGGVASARTEGTPQGGPLSPLLSNILLDRSGPGTGKARAWLLPLCGRLQHLCRKQAKRRAGDDGGHGVSGAQTETESQCGQERGGAVRGSGSFWATA